MNSPRPIDVWNVASFDETLLAKLRGEERLVRDYLTTSQRLFEEQEAARGRILVQENEHGQAYQAFVEDVGRDMNSRVIRAWHYTRLTDDELALVLSHGLHLSTLNSLRRRLDARVTAGAFGRDVADALYAASPMHHQPMRAGKFYMASEPVPINDTGVKLLLGNWGGEATYFWLEDDALKKVVASVGRPRVFEVAVPVASTMNAYNAGKSVVCAFAHSLGLPADRGDFDVRAIVDLPPDAVLRVHTEGEETYLAIGRGYPARFSSER